jgi:uncharacterized protein (DUF2336 family)
MSASHSLINELEDAISSGTSERRLSTLRRVADLFLLNAEAYSDEQVQLFDDVIYRLANAIELKARAELASRIAPIANAPLRVVNNLALDDSIEVAGPVLAQSSRVNDDVLLQTAKTKGQQHLLAISKRQSLSETVTDVLVERGDQHVVRTVAGNAGARFSERGFGQLVDRAASDELLTELVGLRRDLPVTQFQQLMQRASAAAQRRLAAADPENAERLKRIIAGMTDTEEVPPEPIPRDYSSAQAELAALYRAGKLDENQVNAFAKARKFEHTVSAMSLLCRLPIEVIERVLLDERNDMALIIAKAADLSWATTRHILLLRTDGRGLSQQDLEIALSNFNRLQSTTAQRALRFYNIRRQSGPVAGAEAVA